MMAYRMMAAYIMPAACLQTCFMSYGRIPANTIMGHIASTYEGGEASVCGCCSKANLYVYTSLRTNQIYSVSQCKFGAITVSCNTSDCSVSFTEVDYNTLKYNVQSIGVPLCNYVNHFSTASNEGACENPGLRSLDLDPYHDILPNITDNEDTDWTVNTHMSCGTTADGGGCNCNITTHASNSLGGDATYPPYTPNDTPLGVNTGIGYNDAITLEVGDSRDPSLTG